jgi:hypothetical protein
VRPGFLILAAVLALGPKAIPAEDARLGQVLAEVARAAATFWHTAPEYIARETLSQKALTLPKRRLRTGSGALEPPKPEFGHREIGSFYVLSSFRTSPEALHEFREVVSVNGEAPPGDSNPDRLRNAVATQDDKTKKALAHEFDRSSLAVTATDFGQLILLFTKSNQGKYDFSLHGLALVGADRAMILDFSQRAGAEAFRVTEPGRDVREPLTGQIWVREAGFVPLRITLATSRHDRSKTIRDEARVDYEPKGDGMVLPVSIVYRRFVNEELSVEGIYAYTDWRPLNLK